MDYQLGMLRMINLIINDWDNNIDPKNFTEILLKRRQDLIEYCEAYEQASFKAKLKETA